MNIITNSLSTNKNSENLCDLKYLFKVFEIIQVQDKEHAERKYTY